MPVGMTMGLSRRIPAGVLVQMMVVVHVQVFVLERLVFVPVGVTLS